MGNLDVTERLPGFCGFSRIVACSFRVAANNGGAQGDGTKFLVVTQRMKGLSYHMNKHKTL